MSSEGIRVDSHKLEAVKQWPRPTSPTNVRSFMGLAEGTYGYVIYCDASRVGLGCVLMQQHVFTDHKSLQYVFTQKELNLCQRIWLEFLKDYDLSVNYHPGKANVVADALRILSIDIVAHVEYQRKELEKDVHRLARLGVHLMIISNGGVTVQNGSESSLAVEKPITPDIGATKLYRDLWEVFWWNGTKRSIADFVVNCPNCQQVKVENEKPGGMTQEINIPTWMWEVINIDFIICLPRTRIHHDSTWVIVDRVTKSTRFLAVKTTDSADDYAKLYINEIVRLHGVPLSIISDIGP
ncbi:hypothetical protein MTR67_034425 [Solanum verrucosum]|uniref:Integrase zinc-binding domain-containing protein n=1 Tax=Solanum verrucosum TaxID=315347 RepID=A0AAF0U868_SOLVR|nr:hypothetical protein MTR67_034425 [Solanum verrucosum]